MNETLILTAVFVGVLMITFVVANVLSGRREVGRLLKAAQPTYLGKNEAFDDELESMIASDNEYIRHYFAVIKKNNPNGLEFRLIRAGFFSQNALRNFNIVRIVVSFLTFALVAFTVKTVFVSLTAQIAVVIAMIASAFMFIFCNAVLDRMGTNKQTAYRKLFPDFMDMLIVCVDAGLSIEAAVTRVTRELYQTNPDFGIHLNIMLLEVRAGRPLRDALANFAARLSIDEARSLAVLFRQSEELGSSVTKALRVFSREMRQKRMVRAEEKANSLPIKMLFPLALFLFPTNLIIVLVPLLIRIAAMFRGLVPQ